MVLCEPGDVVNADSGGADECIESCDGGSERPTSTEVVCSACRCGDCQAVGSLDFFG